VASRAAVVLANVLPTTRTVWIEHYEDGARGTPQDTRDALELRAFGAEDAGGEVTGLERYEVVSSEAWRAQP